ncbi:Calpain-11 [Collichthys lucidus]|uniref:Calpain-11 n=1 Tax=Collichthys lucidus TaxID=240159 RepID=A0A4U5V506_COLLU|nr:Calpain-11 [Collichthys lucidus]
MSETGKCTSIINLRYQDGSEGSPSNPAKYNNQDYAHLKDSYLRRKQLFVDRTFPPNSQSLGNLSDLSSRRQSQVEWLRPKEIMEAQNISGEPAFCTKGASRFDFAQGFVGNCWFLAAINSLTFHKSLMVQVVPMDQSFNNYAGIFHFRFWRFGKWVDVVIDDYLPTLNKSLLSVSSKSQNEFWAPLLEKAYAKVCGTYADMSAGWSTEAAKDFSGGVHMSYQLRGAHDSGHDKNLWLSLERATGCNSMICCGTAQKGGEIVNTVAHTGLVDAHAYSVTAVTEVEYYGSKVKLVRVMNPWGRQEWNGKWGDKSDMWKRVRPEDQEKCFNREDGEFWMELEDFCHYFSDLCICCENPNFLDGDLSCQWQCMIYDGSWVAGKSAGGNVNERTFATNPQYRIQVTVIDEKEQGDVNILLSLMQKPQQENRKEIRTFPMALTLFKTPQVRLDSDFFRRNRPVKKSQLYTYERDLIEPHSLQPGEYVIVPSTAKSLQECRIPTDGNNDTDKDPIRALFNSYADQKGELDAVQLRKLLNDKFPHGIDLNDGMVRLLMFRHSGYSSTSLEDFIGLMFRLEKVSNVFKNNSSDGVIHLSWEEFSNFSLYN